jgi:hypothetical protein
MTAAVPSARRMADERTVRPEPVTVRAVRGRHDDPAAIAGVDEVATTTQDHAKDLS